MSCLFGFSSRRLNQLKVEENLNRIFDEKCLNVCPVELAQYLLWRRQVNKDQFVQVDDASIFTKCDIVEEHMNEIDNHHNYLTAQIEKECDLCQVLKEILKN